MSNVLNLTFERASASGAYLGKDGLLKFAPVDEPVLEFNLGGTFRGYRVRTPRTNLLLRSEEFDNAYWTKVRLNTTGTPPWVNVAVAPDGTTTAEKMIENTENGAHIFSRTFGIPSAGTYVLSIHAKQSERTRIGIGNTTSGHYAIFDTSNGSVVQASQSTVSGGKLEQAYSNGWYRFSCVITVTAATSVGVLLVSSGTTISYTGDGTSGIFIWGAQLEVGNTATPYIQTTSASVTTSPDIAFKDPATDILSQGSGAIYFEWENPVEELVYLSDFEFTAVAGINKVRFEYSPTLIRLNVNGTQLTDISGTFDFTGLDRIEVGNFDGSLQPDNIYFRAIQTGQ
jgi:flagellin-like hook-associated protein FlgL